MKISRLLGINRAPVCETNDTHYPLKIKYIAPGLCAFHKRDSWDYNWKPLPVAMRVNELCVTFLMWNGLKLVFFIPSYEETNQNQDWRNYSGQRLFCFYIPAGMLIQPSTRFP